MASTRIKNLDDYGKDIHPETKTATATVNGKGFEVNLNKTPNAGGFIKANEGGQPRSGVSFGGGNNQPTHGVTLNNLGSNGPTVGSGNAGNSFAKSDDGDPYAQVINGSSTPKSDPTYEYLRGVSRQDLLDANVMTQISNEIARKNMQGDLQAMGLANSGYAGTAAALRENATQGQLMANQRAYNEAMRNIDYQERTAQQGTLAAQADEITSSLANIAEGGRDAFLEQNGLVKDGRGRWVNGETTNYSDVMLNGINNAYFQANNPNVDGQTSQSVSWLSSAMTSLSVADRQKELGRLGLVYDSRSNKWVAGKDCKLSDSEIEALNISWKDAGYSDQIASGTYNGASYGKTDWKSLVGMPINGGTGSDISYEIHELVELYKDKTPQEGHLVWLENGQDANKYAVLRWQNGKWVQVANTEGISRSQCEFIKGSDSKYEEEHENVGKPKKDTESESEVDPWETR